ncbi:alpha/beta hydrolase [Olleya sp. YSTF-M6]|uniref:Alpha/beta hydrolase n=1 Tax=Olleya sediminilitoris TaxID=2795739 RepID=A0ABS1WJS1_9FLAO|nr:YqiA/YcfP family alpha/beta fold hydrolase [Olleya sediminilitoris]MBL7559372.1 alpha/beta hydrolase [Olleya sediminilitoris]
MSQQVIPVYLMPGMAANPTIFEHIKLPEHQYQIHWLEWKIPENNESISSYAKRICQDIKHDNPVLIGVSFGGILVQEISKLINTKKVIIVSSVKTKHELPKRMKLLKATKAYKILPTQLLSNIDLLAKYAFGNTITKRIELYKKYLSVSDKNYLDWAIEQVVCWEQEQPIDGVVHIHGDNDLVFPFSNLSDCITIKGGTHIMIINRYRWFNQNLPKLIA